MSDREGKTHRERLYPVSGEFRDIMDKHRALQGGINALADPVPTDALLNELGQFVLRREVTTLILLGEMYSFEARTKRRVGRPATGKLNSVDARRAYRVWRLVQEILPARFSVRELITLIQRVEERRFGKRSKEAIFPKRLSLERLEQSVSIGKAILGIDAGWQSATCEELRDI